MAEEDIFMDYAASSSPIDAEPQQPAKIQLNIPRIGNSLNEILLERNGISSKLKNSSSNTQETRLKVLQLRRFNRHLSNVITEHRKRLNELKDVVDNLNSKLLCQKFEKHHLLDEIKSCLSSKNIFETIELEPLELNDPLTEISDSHELMIKRLQRELCQRQELQSQLISILQKKQQTELELEKKKRKIEDLRSHLQNIIKTSKPLIDACGYDLEAFHKKKMAIDETISTSENDKNNSNKTDGAEDEEKGIEIIYEKLVSFVSDKPNFKLRYLGGDEEEEEAVNNGEEEENNETNSNRSTIKSNYIQIIMEIDDTIEPLEIFLKYSETPLNLLLLTVKHELLPENGISTWLKGLETIEFLDSVTENNSWLAPKKLQPDSLNFSQDSEIFNEIFSALKEAIKIRNQLQILIQDNFELLEFDKNDPNEVVLIGRNLKAKISMNSINWHGNEDENDLISNLNSIGSKYRSVIDCLQAQLEILTKNK